MLTKVPIAGVQVDPRIFEKKQNLEKVIHFSREAHKGGAKIVVFPECTLTGYCFSDPDEVISVAEPIPGPSTGSLHKICKEMDILLLVGLVERAGSSEVERVLGKDEVASSILAWSFCFTHA